VVVPFLNIVVSGTTNVVCSANNNNLAMTGQHINLTAQANGGTFSNFQWTVPGYAISNYTAGVGGNDAGTSTNVTTPESLTTYFPTTNANVSFYWVDGGGKSVSCLAVCGGINYSTNVTISVTRPALSMYSQSTPMWYDYIYPPTYIIGISLGENDTDANDLEYKVLINSPTDGLAESVQIANGFSVNGTEQVTGQQADGRVPYQTFTPTTIPKGGTRDSWIELDDSPGAGPCFYSVSLEADFNDYVMYQATIANTIYAPLGGDTIFVPLGIVHWSISGKAYYTGLDDSTINPDDSEIDDPDNSTGFPIWTSIFLLHD
jgi:hypothetical protein